MVDFYKPGSKAVDDSNNPDSSSQSMNLSEPTAVNKQKPDFSKIGLKQLPEDQGPVSEKQSLSLAQRSLNISTGPTANSKLNTRVEFAMPQKKEIAEEQTVNSPSDSAHVDSSKITQSDSTDKDPNVTKYPSLSSKPQVEPKQMNSGFTSTKMEPSNKRFIVKLSPDDKELDWPDLDFQDNMYESGKVLQK
jgi:hypothetical protein